MRMIAFMLLMSVLMILSLIGCGRESSSQYYASPACTVSSISGGALVKCPDGSTSVVLDGEAGSIGSVGSVGPMGPQGQQGISGIPGSPGSVITSVQLCPSSYIPSYPSTFPEVALCIDNTLYAVYSSLGGYLFELIPGIYSSNGVGVSCTVTVGNNCQVSNQ